MQAEPEGGNCNKRLQSLSFSSSPVGKGQILLRSEPPHLVISVWEWLSTLQDQALRKRERKLAILLFFFKKKGMQQGYNPPSRFHLCVCTKSIRHKQALNVPFSILMRRPWGRGRKKKKSTHHIAANHLRKQILFADCKHENS